MGAIRREPWHREPSSNVYMLIYWSINIRNIKESRKENLRREFMMDSLFPLVQYIFPWFLSTTVILIGCYNISQERNSSNRRGLLLLPS